MGYTVRLLIKSINKIIRKINLKKKASILDTVVMTDLTTGFVPGQQCC